MNRIRVFASRIRALFARSRRNAELEQEFQTHIDFLTAEYQRSGLPAEEARYAALRSFGGVARIREEYRQTLGLPWLESTLQDLHYAVRSLAKRRGLLFAAVVSLALGIGANIAIFSVLHAALLRPLPFADPHRLVLLFETSKGGRTLVSYPNLGDWKRQNHSFESLSAFGAQSLNATGTHHAERLRGGFVCSSFFAILRIQPILGRGFAPEDDGPGANRVAVISHAVWQRRYASNPDVLLQTITLNAEPYTIVGVLPAEFRFPIDDIDVWVPTRHILTSQPAGSLERGSRVFLAIGRLQDGVTVNEARADMEAVTAALAREYPIENTSRGAAIVPLHDFLLSAFKPTLVILMGAVTIVLLIACANVANLMLARATQRERELAVRAALGAGPGRLARQLLLEGIVLGMLGGAFGLLIAAGGIPALTSMAPIDAKFATEPRIDGVVLAFTLAVSFVIGVLSCLAPALRASHVDLNRAFQDGGTAVTPLHGRRVRGLFIAAEVALSMILLVGAGLLLQSLYRLLHVDFGFAPEKLLTMEYRLLRAKYKTTGEQWEFHRRVIERIAQLPGVQSAALVRAAPYSGNGGAIRFTPLRTSRFQWMSSRSLCLTQ